MPNTVFEQRVRAAWRARACAAGVATGAMIFSAGAGLAIPICLNAATLSTPPVLLLSALIAWRAQRVLRKPKRCEDSAFTRILWGLLALTLALCAAYLICAQIALAEQTLLVQARVGWIALTTLIALGLCALSGGIAVARMCFLVRWVLPFLLITLGAKALQKGTPIGLFPVLGTGLAPLGLSSLCMLCAATPALLLLAPADGQGGPELVPPARFFVLRVLAGGLMGALLLLSLTLCNTYDTLLSQTVWGERMLVTCTHEPRLGIPQMALILSQLLGLGLGISALLCAAEQAAGRTVKPLRTRPRALGACLLIATVTVFTMIRHGLDRTVYIAPALLAPALLLLLFSGMLRSRGSAKP